MIMRILRALFPRWIPESYHVRGHRVTRREFHEMRASYNQWCEPFPGVICYPRYTRRFWDKWIDKIDPALR